MTVGIVVGKKLITPSQINNASPSSSSSQIPFTFFNVLSRHLEIESREREGEGGGSLTILERPQRSRSRVLERGMEEGKGGRRAGKIRNART